VTLSSQLNYLICLNLDFIGKNKILLLIYDLEMGIAILPFFFFFFFFFLSGWKNKKQKVTYQKKKKKQKAFLVRFSICH
jgi:hypothetical protein